MQALSVVFLAFSGLGLGQPVLPDGALPYFDGPPPPMPEGLGVAPVRTPPLPIVYVDPTPVVPAGSWWGGTIVPTVHQRHIYYPTWDHPVRAWAGLPPIGAPADEIEQGIIPIFWKRPGQ